MATPIYQNPKANVSSWGNGCNEATLVELCNGNVKVTLTSYGARLLSLQYRVFLSFMVHRNGVCEETTLNYVEEKDPESYSLRNNNYFGCIAGRYANRIAKGKFTLNGHEYTLPINNGPNSLHGGSVGLDQHFWESRILDTDCDPDMSKDNRDTGVEFSLLSKDMDQGYPGNLKVSVKYIWNLSGNFKRGIGDHTLFLNCDFYLPVDNGQIPTGEVKSVKDSPFDFTEPSGTLLGPRLSEVDGGGERGFDHCFVVRSKKNSKSSKGTAAIAAVFDKISGRLMRVSTDQPGVQVYTGNFLSKDRNEMPLCQHMSICLETQKYPDSPNHHSFPSTVLKPGEIYRHHTIHKFSIVSSDETQATKQ
uniref:Aldose 1-epimerase n=1 Tax=Aplanochytrium stocchinoi TaxID=215587 RepID=A0A7S3PFS8_9STRA|eukprot:CAMPEP_0204870724 /NCGR_PEP_ID=MMETSP1348-20121228/33427_1 /ASSEMBLY_ACC=CAM_ASM_000700 /TAXON_ID=215587 /ORGANISM="Aplanochytrium stocchinoi, Strain GSBS06" /LENGTH=361 /DNA_ID=CAMNT_0052024693 /DNA_START=130 /DNA_END=1215 /DNA_ORIENTATION=-